jgi:hypothetical protein
VPDLAPQRPVLEQRARHLLDEERVPLGFGGDEGPHLSRQLGVTQQRRDDRPHLARREREQRDTHVIAPVAERMAVPWPVRTDEKHPRRRHHVCDERQILLRRRVDPVEVLDDQHERPFLRQSERQRLEGAERFAPPARRVERRDRCVARVERQHLAHEGQGPAEVVA